MNLFGKQLGGRRLTKGAGYYTGSVLHVVGYIAVFGLTATCTFLMFQQYAPKDALWIPFLSLALVEYGTFKWWHYARHNAENIFQLLISIALGSASIIGIAACTGLEMSQWFGISFALQWKQVALIYIIVLAVIEVIGFVGVGIVSNKNLSHWATLGLGTFQADDDIPHQSHTTVQPVSQPEQTFTRAQLEEGLKRAYDEGHQHASSNGHQQVDANTKK